MASASSESSGTTISGRSSPEDELKNMHNFYHASHAFNHFGANFPARRSSTPATSFLPPRFWHTTTGSGNTVGAVNNDTTTKAPELPGLQRASTSSATLTSGNKLQQSHSHSGETNTAGGLAMQHNAFVSLPRRTSFGTYFGGGRLSALTALGMSGGAGGVNQGVGSPSQDIINESAATRDLKSKTSMGRLAGLPESAVGSTESTPAPSMPSSPVQKPQRTRTVLLPGPDGICVESFRSRSRRRSEA